MPGAVSYTWTTSVAGAVVSGTTTSCSISFPAAIPGGSTVSVVANSSCPTTSAVRSKGIASGLPGVPGSISGPASGQCGATGVSYSITPLALATGYSWSTTCGTLIGPANLSAVTVDWPASFTVCTLLVSANNACGTGITRVLAVNGAPGIPAVITGNASPCANATETYSTAGTAGATDYTWTVPPGATIIGGQGSTSLIVLWGATGGNITVRASNACGNSPIRSLPCTISCRMNQVNATGDELHAQVFPNPTNGNVTLKFTSTTSDMVSFNVMDIEGRTLLSENISSVEGINLLEKDLSAFAKGIYFIHLKGMNWSEVIRVVVE